MKHKLKIKSRAVFRGIALFIAFIAIAFSLSFLGGCAKTPTRNAVVIPPTETGTSGSPGTNPNYTTSTPKDTTVVPNETETQNTTLNIIPANTSAPTPPAMLVYNILIENFRFNPNISNIELGSSVIWTNEDSVMHAILSDNGTELDSGTIAPAETFAHTFNTTGNFTYHCTIHSYMHGVIVVAGMKSSEATVDSIQNSSGDTQSNSGSTQGTGGYGEGYYY